MDIKLMHISNKGIKLAEQFEGIRYTPYDDGCGNMTIGIGHLIKEGEVFDHKLTDAEVYDLYRKDVLGVGEARVKAAVHVDVPQNIFDVLVDMAFNLQYLAFMNSSVVRLVNEKKFDEAAERLFRYNKAFSEKKKQYIVMPGLTKRCKARYDLWKSID